MNTDNIRKENNSLVNPLVKELYDLTFDLTNKCVQCGYCLPVCPTYESMGNETQSPRGRINLVKLASMGKIDITEHLSTPIDLCVGCRACEAACPVGVPYGEILDHTTWIISKEQEDARKENIQRSKQSRSNIDSSMKRLILDKVLIHPKRLRSLGNITWFYQKSRINKLIRKTKVLEKISRPIAELEKALPILEDPGNRLKPGIYEAKGIKKARVAFFTGCVTDATMYRTNRLSVELLTLVGLEVVIPQEQKCCGAIHAHQSMKDGAMLLAKENIKAFEQTDTDFYVNNAGGCGAMLREYDKLLEEKAVWSERAAEFARKSRDISELLYNFGPLPFQKEWNGVITYQDSCHLRNVQNVYKEPRELLKSIPCATFIELEDNKCCGSGGIYNIIHFKESMEILDLKMDKVKRTNATTVVTANPGCLLQVNIGINRHGLSDSLKTAHLVDILAEACGIK